MAGFDGFDFSPFSEKDRRNSLISTFYTRSHILSSKAFTSTKAEKVRDVSKILIVMSMPAVAIVVVTSLGLIEGVRNFNSSKFAIQRLQDVIILSDVVGMLQTERGLTSMYLSSNKSNQLAFNQLLAARNLTNKNIERVKWWTETEISDGPYLNSTRDLRQYIDEFRVRVTFERVEPINNINFYTNINTAILDKVAAAVTLKGSDRLLVAFDSLLRASNAYGILRAIGSSYYAPCQFSKELEKMFNILNTKSQVHMRQLFMYRPGSKDIFSSLVLSLYPLEENLQNSTQDMLDLEFKEYCKSLPEIDRFYRSIQWFENMTSLISVLTQIRTVITSDLYSNLDRNNRDAKKTFVTSLLIMTVISIVALATMRVVLYMTRKVELQALASGTKTRQLENEQKRTESILNQLLPKVIIEQLKEQKQVKAEFYDCVTIYFSDIVGFTNISSRLQPQEVVHMLNEIYGTFDAILDRHDVYKVETIGDAYLVASGLPLRNGNKHANEIAKIAVKISQAIKTYSFYPENGGCEAVRLRIGLHSGPCAAGVVGLKMPRYCIFGEALIIAQHLETTGLPNKIQISSFTRFLLEGSKKFVITPRDSTTVQGKILETFWLEERETRQDRLTVSLQLPSDDDGELKISASGMLGREPKGLLSNIAHERARSPVA